MKIQETNKDAKIRKLQDEIRKLKKSRNEIKKSKDHYQHLIENAGEIITVLNYDGTIRFENPALKRILGYKPEELLDNNLLNYIHPEDRKDVEQKLAEVIESVGNKSSLEFRYKHKKGDWRHLESFAKNIADPKFGPGLLINSRDITDRVKTRTELEKNRQKLFHAHQIARIGGWEWDIEKNEITISKELRKIIGVEENAKINTLNDALQLVHPNDRDRTDRIIRKALDDKKGYKFEYRILLPNGEVKFLFGRGEIETDGNGKAIKLTGVGQDITELKETEQKLQVYTQKLKNLTAKQEKVRENERIRIARDIHDELGQMLTVLKMDISTSINRRKKEYGDKYMSRYSEEISEVVNGIDTIIQSVQRITMELRPSALVDLGLKDALEWQGSEFQKQTGILLKFICTDDSVDSMDEELTTAVFRIFQEILTNIMRHSKATKVDVLLTHDEKHQLIMRVRDNGRGISTEEVEASDSLGILGMRERTAIFGGVLNVEGVSGIGTTVTLKIPAERKSALHGIKSVETKMSGQ